MASITAMIPPEALTLNHITHGCCLRTPNEWVLQKIVPATIVAQALFGYYEITCEGRSEVIRPGEAFLTPANRSLRLIHHGDPAHDGWMGARWLHLHFTLFDTLDLLSLMDLPLRIPSEPAGRLGVIIQELVDSLPPKNEFSMHWFTRRHELAFSALHILCEIAPLRPKSLTILQHSGRLTSVFSYIRDYFAEPLSVSQLAQLAHMSSSRFHVFFHQHMGCTPMDYVKQVRLSEACKLLVLNDSPLAQIAERVGFCNQYHFSREFKAFFHMTPSQYRKDSSSLYGDELIFSSISF